MTYISGVLYYLSTCINPLLYNIMSNKFREAFKVCKFNRFLSRLAQNSNRLLSYCILNELNELNGILNVCAFARSPIFVNSKLLIKWHDRWRIWRKPFGSRLTLSCNSTDVCVCVRVHTQKQHVNFSSRRCSRVSIRVEFLLYFWWCHCFLCCCGCCNCFLYFSTLPSYCFNSSIDAKVRYFSFVNGLRHFNHTKFVQCIFIRNERVEIIRLWRMVPFQKVWPSLASNLYCLAAIDAKPKPKAKWNFLCWAHFFSFYALAVTFIEPNSILVCFV